MNRTTVRWMVAGMTAAFAMLPRSAAAIPVFARIYDKPCGACHTVFPQLNPAGEAFRAHGLHGMQPAIAPLDVGGGLTVPGTLPLALYLAAGENVRGADAPGDRDATVSHFNLDFLRVLGGGELGPHLAFLFDHEMLEMEDDTGETVVNTLPYQAYLVAHLARGGWLWNLKGGWYELPFAVSPQIHRLTVRPYLGNELSACALLGIDPPRGHCDDVPIPGETQLGAEIAALHEPTGLGLTAGFTNGSNNHVDGAASKDVHARVGAVRDGQRAGFWISYSPDLVGRGVDDRAVRFGPEIDLYSRRFRVLGQWHAAHESNPTGHGRGLWYYGTFLEGQYRFRPDLLTLARVDLGWSPTFDDRNAGGDTRTRHVVWEVTAGAQWLIVENVRLIAEVTYGEDTDTIRDRTAASWSGTLRLATAFWPLTPPFVATAAGSDRP